MVKRDGVILEKSPSLRVREDGWVFEKEVLEETLNLSRGCNLNCVKACS